MGDFLFLFLLAVAIFFLVRAIFPAMGLSKPSHQDWKPVSNADDSYRFAAYKEAAQKLGVQIRFGYPVPCPAGADLCARMGMKGVYISRAQADKADALTHEMHNAFSAMSR